MRVILGILSGETLEGEIYVTKQKIDYFCPQSRNLMICRTRLSSLTPRFVNFVDKVLADIIDVFSRIDPFAKLAGSRSTKSSIKVI